MGLQTGGRPGRRSAAARLGCLLAGVLAGAGAPAAARADRSFDVAMATPAVDAYGLTVIDRAQTPQRFEFGVQAQFGWAYNPLRLALADRQQVGNPDNLLHVIEQQYTVDLGFSLGLADFLSVAVALPMGVNIYDDNVIGDSNAIILPATPAGMGAVVENGLYANQPRQNVGVSNAGPRDPRLALKARFYGGRWFEIGMILEGTLPIGNSASFLGEKSATFRPRLLTGILLKRVVLALSLGAIIREGSDLYDPVRMPLLLRMQSSHELTWGAGLSVKAHRVLGFGLEATGTTPLPSDPGALVSPTALLLGSVYLQPTEKWKLTLAGGGGVLSANPAAPGYFYAPLSSPRNADGRIIVGLSYSLSPRAGGLL